MLTRKPHSKYWYFAIREGRKVKWYSTGLEKEEDAKTIYDEIIAKRKELKRQSKISYLLGNRALLGESKNKPLLLSQAWEKYCSVNDRWSDAGRKNYFHFCEWLKTDKDIADITIDTALAFLEPYRKSAGKTFNNYKSSLSMVWKTLIPYSNIKVNPWINIQNRSVDSDFYRPITPAEYKKILGVAKGFWRDATVIAYYTGLRRKDIQTLQWRQVYDDHIELVPAKTSANQKSVFIPLHSEVSKILEGKKRKGLYVFPVEAEKLTNGGFNHEYSVILSGLGITAKSPAMVGFHSLRASFITRCEEAGIERKTIQGIVGHGSPLMTARYSHDTESAKKILNLS